MVFGQDVGVVLRARKGRNILLQPHGLDVKAVAQASSEVAAVLEGDLPSSIELLDTGAGTQASLVCGHLRVLGNRYAVVYRLLHHVLIIIVSRAHSNVFASLNLVSAVSRLLVVEAKTVELTPERLLKKYAQVYLSIDALVGRGTLDLAGALLDANAQLESITPDGIKARRARQQAERAAAAAAAAGRGVKQISRRVADPHQDHARFAFQAPSELTSLQVNLPVYQLPELPQPDRPLQIARPAASAPLLEEKQPDKDEEGDKPWTSFEQEEQQQQPSPLLQYQGPPLQLAESWQAEVVGSRIMRAGLVGAVKWVSTEAKALSGSIPFQLQPPEHTDPAVATALKCALASERGVKVGQLLGSFLADTLSCLPASSALLQYHLPATFSVLPLLVRMTGGHVEQKNGAGVALLTVQYQLPREFELLAKDLVADLFVPPGFNAPRRIEPQGATWSGSQSLLRWQITPATAGIGGCLVAAFRVTKDKGGVEAAAAGLSRCYAVLRLRGQGGTITGVQMAQSGAATTPAAVEPNTNSWAAFVLARPGGVARQVLTGTPV
eukprot:GHRR01021333.1.p1 GENE.GHRR01021333.1~~GHRR01021333.1.p1  ORF type:complete len:553 (+),score=155.38 GHRR01021333.1:577-2235(+)